MQFSTIAAIASLLSTALAAPHAHAHSHELEVRQTPSRVCSKQTGGVHIIAIPGEGSTNPPYGLLSSLAASLMKAIPGSSNISMPYNHSETNGIKQTGDATVTLHTWIQQYHTACPKTKIVLIGYSSGAITELNTICGEGPQYQPNQPQLDGATYGPTVIAAVAYGDETRTANQAYNQGTCKDVGIHPRPAASAACGKGWGARLQSYCDADDPMCCVATGTSQANHYVYPQRYDAIATQFVLAQLKKFGGP